MDNYFQELDYSTREAVQDTYKLSNDQMSILVRAYNDLALIGGLLFRNDIDKLEIRYITEKGDYFPVPRIMRNIINSTPKDEFHKYFSPFAFKSFFARFVKSVLSPKNGIRNGADLLGNGTICYKKSATIEVEQSEFRS